MKYMNCRDVRRDIDRAGSNDYLSPAAHAHLETCQSCATLSRQQSNLHSILSSLPHVETPNDFDFRVRARIADGRQARKSFGGFSFGLRVAAAAMVLIAAAAVSLFVTLKSGGNDLQVASNQQTPSTKKPEQNAPQANPVNVAVAPAATDKNQASSSAGSRTPRQREIRSEVASYRGSRVGTRDTSTTPAAVVRRLEQTGTYPSGPFPINASYQSLKVSVDNGRGSSRTISLPTVSFGSQRTLSQNTTPLMASARGVW